MFNFKEIMKAILYKREDNFYSLKVDRIVMATSNGMLVDYNLSKENCDSLFGVIDVEKLADELKVGISYKEYDHLIKRGIIVGFNKAMELNKDKLFTLEDIKRAISFGQGMDLWKEEEQIDKLIQSLQQPTEIDVEIEMEDSIGIGDKYTPEPKPLLDEQGCLILKKI
jgi:hypothetical protein